MTDHLLRLLKDTTPIQRGIIRHTLLVLDLSSAMSEKDLRPTRYLLTLSYALAFVAEYFEQNPISQLGILGMRDGLAVRVSDVSGDPTAHARALQDLRAGTAGTEPRGEPSLQNALDMARAALHHVPRHGTREVLIVLGALHSSDPGDIHASIRSCARAGLRVSVIGLAARLHVCADLCAKTGGSYAVVRDEVHFRELLMAVTTPPVVQNNASDAASAGRAGGKEGGKAGGQSTAAALLMMGFPSRVVQDAPPALCACHGTVIRGGYACSRCSARVCSLPTTCPLCSLTLVLSTHLARSYHHLFPLRNWEEVSWARAREVGSAECAGCLAAFPSARGKGQDGAADGAGATATGQVGARAKGASESFRYECPACARHFCIDCDVFCHQVAHNCPGCQSRVTPRGGLAEDGEEESTRMEVEA